VGKAGVVKVESLEEGLSEVLSERNIKYIPQNMEAIRKGVELVNR
jgi:Pyruvate/2-oxoacid:ferredoxin oxidoreductase gamma subunit